MLLRGNILEVEEPLGVDYRGLVVLEEGLEVEGGSTIIWLEVAALSRSLFIVHGFALGLGVVLRVIEGGWGMGMELSLQMCFDFWTSNCQKGAGWVTEVGDAGAMGGFAVLGRWFHHRQKVGRN
eukprot:scaffold44012_cov75-Attheya_sp.AAC.1